MTPRQFTTWSYSYFTSVEDPAGVESAETCLVWRIEEIFDASIKTSWLKEKCRSLQINNSRALNPSSSSVHRNFFSELIKAF